MSATKTNTFGERVKAFRCANGYNQSNIADFLHVDQSLISKIEKGERSLTADMLEKLADLFGVPVSAFEQGDTSVEPLSVAFRARNLSVQDMETLSAINRIALNTEFLAHLVEAK